MEYKNQLFIIYLLSFIFNAAWYGAFPFFALILLKVLKISPGAIGIALSVSYVTYLASSFKAGRWIDKYGAEKMTILSCTLLSFAFIVLYLYFSFIVFIIVNLILGVLRAIYRSSINVLLKNYAKEQSHSAYNIAYATINGGSAIGMVMGAFFASNSSTLIYIYCAGVFFVAALLTMPLHLKRPVAFQTTNNHSNFINLIKTPFMFWLLLAGFIYLSIYPQLNITLPMSMQYSSNNNIFNYAKLLLLNAVLIVAFQYPLHFMIQRISFIKLALISCFTTIAALIIIASTHIMVWLYLAITLYTVGEAILMPLLTNLIAEKAPKDERGHYFSIFNLAYIGGFFGPALGGILIQYHLSALLYYGLALSMFICLWAISKADKIDIAYFSNAR